jgi:hypothetical protein
VTDCATLADPMVVEANVNDDGLALSDAVAAVVPVPDSETVVGLFVALLVTVSDPVLVPVVVGRNVTDTEHEAPAAIELPQVLVWA